MRLAELNKQLLTQIVKDEHDAASNFLNFAEQIESLCYGSQNIISGIDLPSPKEGFDKAFIDKILIATVFSDIVRLYSGSAFSSFKNTRDYRNYQVQEAREVLSYYNITDLDPSADDIIIHAGVNAFTEEEGAFLQERLLPLFDQERITLSPKYSMLIIAGGNKLIKSYVVPAETHKKLWRVPLTGPQQSVMPITEVFNGSSKEMIDSIFIPYLAGISVEEFAKILQDEADLISSFRKEMKSLTLMALKNSTDVREFYQDAVRPRVDKINQKFKSISSIHRLKVGGVIAVTASLSLLSLAAGEYFTAASLALGVGTGSAGLVKFEAEYQGEISNLRSDPLFLLWKFKHPRV